jgi:hypothetical protein
MGDAAVTMSADEAVVAMAGGVESRNSVEEPSVVLDLNPLIKGGGPKGLEGSGRSIAAYRASSMASVAASLRT